MQKRKIFGKNTFVVEILKGFNGILFGDSRDNVRKKIGGKYTEYKRNEFSINSIDDYDLFTISYDADNKFECIEFVSGKVYLNNIQIFPGSLKKASEVIRNLKYDGYGYSSEEESVGITTSEDDNNMIETILFACEGYYRE